MEVRGAKINQFLVEVFDQILRREEERAAIPPEYQIDLS